MCCFLVGTRYLSILCYIYEANIVQFASVHQFDNCNYFLSNKYIYIYIALDTISYIMNNFWYFSILLIILNWYLYILNAEVTSWLTSIKKYIYRMAFLHLIYFYLSWDMLFLGQDTAFCHFLHVLISEQILLPLDGVWLAVSSLCAKLTCYLL